MTNPTMNMVTDSSDGGEVGMDTDMAAAAASTVAGHAADLAADLAQQAEGEGILAVATACPPPANTQRAVGQGAALASAVAEIVWLRCE